MKINRRQAIKGIITLLAGGSLIVPNKASSEIISTREEILKKEYDFRERQFVKNIERFSKGEPIINYTSAKLEYDYPLDQFIECLGGLWYAMSEEEKRRTARIWDNTRAEPNRRTILGIYVNTFEYVLKRLSQEQKDQFNEFNNAYLYAINNFNRPTREMFATVRGEATDYYKRNYPWVPFEKPDVSSRVLIWCQEYRDGNSPNRLNLRNIQEFNRLAMNSIQSREDNSSTTQFKNTQEQGIQTIEEIPAPSPEK